MNRVVLEAELAERAAMRYTPAGLPALDMRLAHQSEVTEAGARRRLQLELKAVAIGDLAHQLDRVALGSAHRFAGFLASQRQGRGVVLHVTELL